MNEVIECSASWRVERKKPVFPFVFPLGKCSAHMISYSLAVSESLSPHERGEESLDIVFESALEVGVLEF
jgi:hypothetical protein